MKECICCKKMDKVVIIKQSFITVIPNARYSSSIFYCYRCNIRWGTMEKIGGV